MLAHRGSGLPHNEKSPTLELVREVAELIALPDDYRCKNAPGTSYTFSRRY